ncbi:VOC family protein [Rahnella aquatilis]|uniref:VOC family protein n=1 Tax=Rahnella aquatilis TaxID=34038 RepID=UPI001E4822D3|nr:VOC family protein [Rahnella aquatilis]
MHRFKRVYTVYGNTKVVVTFHGESLMFSHVHVGARNLSKLVCFYEAILSRLGLVQIPEGNGGSAQGVGWKYPDKRWPQFYVQLPVNGLPSTWGNGVQVSFLVASHADVKEIWELAITMGGTDEGPPGFREYATDFFAAYCRDPEGNKLCFVCAPEA